MMDKRKEVFEAWQTEMGFDSEGLFGEQMERAFQAGWNARPGVTVPVEVVEEIETCAAMKVPSDEPDFMHDFPLIDMQQRFDDDRVYWETLCIGEADLARRLLRKIKEAESALKGGGSD